jgi:FixJ family two-component response regulator
MTKKDTRHIFFVDDEPKLRQVIKETLEQLNLEVTCFSNGAECLERLGSCICDLLITDVKMPEMNGIELMIQVKNIAPWVPVLIITGYGDIPMAVKAVKAGAIDFIEKPLEKETFLLKVKSILKEHSSTHRPRGKPLTKNETGILKLIIEGKSNREIAQLLHRSIRTVEVHRSRVMQKLGVDNLVDLIKTAVSMRLVDMPEENNDENTKQ